MRVSIVSAILLSGTAVAAPSLVGTAVGLVTDTVVAHLTDTLKDAVQEIESHLDDAGVSGFELLSKLGEIQPILEPSSIEDIVARIQKLGGVKLDNFIGSTVELVLNSLGPATLATVLQQYSDGINSEDNVNTREPKNPVYPTAAAGDQAYSINEEKLRAAIYIPDTFTYGKKPPVILCPATGTKGGFTYNNNFAKLLAREKYADPVWLNIPGWLLEDIAWNSEYVAYAINYIAGITSRNVSVVGLSQGNLNIQWALTYWPSTRAVVSDYIGISPDYKGSVIVSAATATFGRLGLPKSIFQQKYMSKFIQAFRRRSAAAFVPTTTIYTANDELVQPQSGTGASGILLQDLSARPAARVTNVELQTVCPLDSASSDASDHNSLLFGGAVAALVKDALTHDGPADVSRIPNLAGECSKLVADGLDFNDVVATGSIGAIAAAAWLLYPNRVMSEPAPPAYAQ